MNRRKLIHLVVGGATGLIVTGCGSNQSSDTSSSTPSGASGALAGGAVAAGGEKFLIGMSQANKGEPWRQVMNDQISAAARAHPELDVQFADAQKDNHTQVSQVENFLQQGIKLLIISPNEVAPLTDVVAKAYDQGIPVILLDRKVSGDKYTMWIGGNNQDIGKRAGEYVAKWAADNHHKPCNVIELRGTEGSSPCKERGDGFREGIKKSPDVKLVAEQNADWDRGTALAKSQQMFAAQPDVDVVFAHNDPMAEAAIISAQTAGKDLSKMLFVGIDGLPTQDGGIKSVMAGRIGVTYVYPTGGAQAIDWALKILKDKATPPKTVVLDTEQVTRSNAAELLKKYGG